LTLAWKGVVGCEVEVYTPISNEVFPFEIGREYIVYAANLVWPACSELSTGICSRTSLVIDAEEDFTELGISTGAAPGFLAKWGGVGAAAGEFNGAMDVAVDAYGNSYVADTFNNRIQKFDRDGGFITEWGAIGIGDGELFEPGGIAVDAEGFVYVADTRNNRVQKFTGEGDYVTQWGEFGFGVGQFAYPEAIGVGPDGLVYIGDTEERVQKYTRDGTYVSEFGGTGIQGGEFVNIKGLDFDAGGNVFVTDFDTWRVQKLTSNGDFLLQWTFDDPCGPIDFEEPSGIAVIDSFVYVSYPLRHRLRMFTPEGALLAEWGLEGDWDGWVDGPLGLAVHPYTGSVYVADTGNNRIQVYGETLVAVKPIATPGGIDVTAYPNPFNPSVTISYSSPDAVVERISIYDVRGGLVRRLELPPRGATEGSVAWDGVSDAGVRVSSGVYFVAVATSAGVVSRKIVMLK
jgi:DNA-binding beta-propeller fold protein YncE